jgi:hypothetical protein
MFGLNDSTNQSNKDTTQPSASAIDTVALPPLTTSVSNDSSSNSNPLLNMAGTGPAPSSAMALGSPAAAMPSSGISDSGIENAYIPPPPPTPPITKHADNSKDKPPDAPVLENKAAVDSSKSKLPDAPILDNNFAGDGKLLDLKQHALQSLAPLVGHLDQTNEEKFKTTMMLIQASDNSDLIPEAYEAANKIEDEKVRAQALLDVVNEINYFTQHANATNAPQPPIK